MKNLQIKLELWISFFGFVILSSTVGVKSLSLACIILATVTLFCHFLISRDN